MRECLRHQCHFQTAQALHFFLPRTSSQPLRFLSTTRSLRANRPGRSAASIKTSLPKKKPSYTPAKAPTTSTSPAKYQTYASILAQKAHPTLLYQAPSHTMFIVCCYSSSLFCFTYATINFWSNYLVPPAELASWVPIAFGMVSVFMAGVGTWLVLGPARLIKTITAMPKSLALAVSQGRAVANAARTAANPELQIEVELRKMFPLPFFPPRKLYIRPDEFVLKKALVPSSGGKMTPEQLRQTRLQDETSKREQLEYERSHIMSAPFRHMSRGLFSLFKATGRAWSREGFMKVDVKGQKYKLDVAGGWALDRGRALDRLAVIKPY